jgi:hypothetical protein
MYLSCYHDWLLAIYLHNSNSATFVLKHNWHAVPLFLLLVDLLFNCYRFVPHQYIAVELIILIYMFGINLPFSITLELVYG